VRFIFLVAIVCSLSCPGHNWTARPSFTSPAEECDAAREFPQMLKIPGFGEAYQVVKSCDDFNRRKTSIALKVFLDEWRKQFGDSHRARRAVDKIMIMWERSPTPEYRSGYSMDGIYFNRAKVRGIAVSKSVVSIFYDNETTPRICQTALAHELVHSILWNRWGHGDPDHLGKRYPGWTKKHNVVIQNTNEVLCNLGI